jgi:hypothetical protein
MPVAHPATVRAPEFFCAVWFGPLVKLGAWLTNKTVIVNVCGALVSTPPLAVPPSSCSRTVTVADPLALAAGVYVNVPFAAIVGCAVNSAVLSLPTIKFSVCPASFAGPALIPVAHPATVCGPAFSSRV